MKQIFYKFFIRSLKRLPLLDVDGLLPLCKYAHLLFYFNIIFRFYRVPEAASASGRRRAAAASIKIKKKYKFYETNFI